MADEQTQAPSHLDVMVFSDFVAGLARAKELLDITKPDVVVNERESPNIPGLMINDGMEYHDVAGYAGRAHEGDFVLDFSLRWNDKTIGELPGDAPSKFRPILAYTDFVATGERDLAIVVPAALAPVAEKVFELTGIRHSETRGPWDDDTYSRENATAIDAREAEYRKDNPFEPGQQLVKFNFSPTAIGRFKSRFAVGITKQEEAA